VGSYILRRLLHAIPILFGVMVITFILFYGIQSPRVMAKRILGDKAKEEAVQNWLHQRGYDKPVFINLKGGNPFDSQFFRHVGALATFNLGTSDATGEPVIERFKQGALPSLSVTLPAFFMGIVIAVCAALYFVHVRDTAADLAGTIGSVVLMSLPIMVWVICGHALFAVWLRYVPAFGFSLAPGDAVRFLALPVCLLVFAGLGSDVRLYRAIFLEESRGEYVRTARAKGLSNQAVLLRHVLKNGMISIITLTVAALPALIMGTLVIEDFFGIPGLGSLALDAIRSSDFSVIRATTYVGSVLYLIGLILTDICYALVDPRIKLR